MAVDIFEFWSQVGLGEKQHPQDREVLQRVKGSFEFDCLPSPFIGPLKTAPVVLLYLSAGFEDYDSEYAKEEAGCRFIQAQHTGTQALPAESDHRTAWKWWMKRTKCFGEWQKLRDKIAVLDVCGYHSRTFRDYPLLTALPSCRVSLDWAQTVLFPKAISGERVVICLRSPQYWGLDAGNEGKKYGKSLFAPRVTRSGHMLKRPIREEIIREAKEIISKA